MNKLSGLIDNLWGISLTNKIFLLQNLSIMIKTGVSLASSLETLGQQTKNKKLKRLLSDVSASVKQGKSFGESLMPYEKDFGELFINMIKAGEVSGQLEEVLKQLYLQSKKDHQLLAKVKSALTYPAIIIVAMLGIGAFVIVFVLPNITGLFKELDVKLPLATRVIIFVNDFVQSQGLIIFLILFFLVLILVKFLRSGGGKKKSSWLLLKLPIIAPIVKKINLARIARSLSSLIKTDIAIINSIEITSRVIGNHVYREALQTVAAKVKKGGKIAEALGEYGKIFPPAVVQIIAVGEETGALDEILENLADFYEEEVSQTMNSLPTIIEPILMLLIGAGVAGIALAILMPMYSLGQNL